MRTLTITIKYINDKGKFAMAEVDLDLLHAKLTNPVEYPSIVDASQRAVANALEELKIYLDNHKNM